jgi:hypothetical protein
LGGLLIAYGYSAFAAGRQPKAIFVVARHRADSAGL